MDWRSVGVKSLCGALIILLPTTSEARIAHPGYSGLISTPNAEVLPQGQLALGFSWLDGLETYLFAPKTNRVYVITLGILPRLEATLRQTQVIGWHDPQAPGIQHAFDRMVSIKYQLPLSVNFPNAAIGVQDIASANQLAGRRVRPGSTQYGQSTFYGVLGAEGPQGSWHLGYARSPAFLDGVFGGIKYNLPGQLALLLEHDSQHVNWGVRFNACRYLSAQIGIIGNNTWGVGTLVEFPL